MPYKYIITFVTNSLIAISDWDVQIVSTVVSRNIITSRSVHINEWYKRCPSHLLADEAIVALEKLWTNTLPSVKKYTQNKSVFNCIRNEAIIYRFCREYKV